MPRRLVIATRSPNQHSQWTLSAGDGNTTACESVRRRELADLCGSVTLALPEQGPPVVHCKIHIPEPEQGDQVTITNLGDAIDILSQKSLHHGESMVLLLPAQLHVAETSIELFWDEPQRALESTLSSLATNRGSTGDSAMVEGPAPSAETLSSWLRALGDLQGSVAGSHEFFLRAARAVCDPGGLDGGMILLPSGSGWVIAASHLPRPENGIGFQVDVVEQSVRAKATLFHNSKQSTRSRLKTGMHHAVASPAFDDDDNVMAVIYGFRSQHAANSRRGIRLLESQFVQVVCDSVAAAMNRMEAEANAARSRALLDQTFSPAVARNLENDPSFLEGRSTEVTVLFADLRGFSMISEKVGAKVTYELLTDVMDSFSATIADHDGVVIDFFGDGLSAFWNAPIEQPEHPLLACLCAMAMLESLTELNERWGNRLGQELNAGIGIHTGIAQVGNSGSRVRLKYGPQGNTVNLASRIEGTTRHVGCPVVVSSETANRIEGTMLTRRICKTQLNGIKKPVNLHQVISNSKRAAYVDRFVQYEQALMAFERKDFQQAILTLSDLQLEDELDPVEQFLLNQAIGFQSGSFQLTDRQNSFNSKSATIAIPKLTETD